MTLISDPSGKKDFAESPPVRIVSLCPPMTELLFDIGIKERVVAVSKQCRFPEIRVNDTESVGSNRRPDIKRIMELNPDFVVLDSRETDEAVVKLLKEEFPVWNSSAATVLEAVEEIRGLGRITDKSANAEWIAAKIETRFAEFQANFPVPESTGKVALLANYKPWTAYGGGTIATELLGYIGLENVFGFESGTCSLEGKKIPGGPSTPILLSEGVYSFHKRHVPVVNRKFPGSPAYLVREDLLTWQGSRLLRTPAYLAELHSLLSQ